MARRTSRARRRTCREQPGGRKAQYSLQVSLRSLPADQLLGMRARPAMSLIVGSVGAAHGAPDCCSELYVPLASRRLRHSRKRLRNWLRACDPRALLADRARPRRACEIGDIGPHAPPHGFKAECAPTSGLSRAGAHALRQQRSMCSISARSSRSSTSLGSARGRRCTHLVRRAEPTSLGTGFDRLLPWSSPSRCR